MVHWKNAFLLSFCLVSSPNIEEYLNKEAFSWLVIIIVLFSEKNNSKLSDFFFKTSKIILFQTRNDYFDFFSGKNFVLRIEIFGLELRQKNLRKAFFTVCKMFSL